tara:strand:- start:51 stop:872 length:822 start_codon:yes stop_codon:yes gene_type:complete
MIKKNILIKIFLVIIVFGSFSFLDISKLEAQEKTDFSNAVDGEEKRAKWGSEEFKQELIQEMSSANVELFIEPHLSSVTEPSRIFYKFEKESTREDNFIGNVVLNIVKIDNEDRKYITFRYLKGRNKVRFPPQVGAKGNPIFMLFFERDARDMQRLTGGNALFFRSRIRHAIAATEVKDIEFKFKDENIEGKEIYFKPFLKTKLKNRISRYKTKEFKVILSKEIPGYIYKIESFSKDTESPDDLVRETLIYQGIKSNKELREEYKQKQGDNKT